ncbi:hypothetical protein BD410DRAFT_822851 [Rickenella mellea]|uniref:Uncharacterized protein n=1 Tax=Rickenella mellea TaxID=50990 RepID=A0A4Y7PN89_9AGAM|nr:hypothetical protein BD410DRAFT_822851 [Rickenella mellea]
MPPTDNGGDSSSSGLFSNVLSFVTREIGSFVATATGGTVPEDIQQPIPSSSRVKSKSRNHRISVERHDARRRSPSLHAVRRQKPTRDPEDAWRTTSQTCLHTVEHSGRSDRKLKDKRGRSPLHSNHYSRSREEIENVEGTSTEELSASDISRSPSPTPPARALRRRPSMTMPGSLFDRSESLEPSPENDWEEVRVVRFAPGTVSPQKARKASSTSVVQPEAGPSQPRATPHDSRGSSNHSRSRSDFPSEPVAVKPVPPSTPFRPRSSVLKVVEQFSGDDPDPSLMLPKPITPEKDVRIRDRKGKGRARDSDAAHARHDKASSDDEHSASPSSFRNGKERARPSELVGDTSGEIRIRGKERELHAARQEQKARENRNENDEKDKDRDKERIRALEEEVKMLRTELARQRETSHSSHPPPPPPPPPPPMPGPSTSLPLSRATTTADPVLANVRASLKHTAPPHENPINPAVYGSAGAQRAKRTGQPTLKIGADDMAAFLKEMKTHRLRKISNGADGSFSSERQERGERGERSMERGGVDVSRSEASNSTSVVASGTVVFPRRDPSGSREDVDLRHGEKRKRVDESISSGSLPPKRRLTVSNPSAPNLSASSSRSSITLNTSLPLSTTSSSSHIPIQHPNTSHPYQPQPFAMPAEPDPRPRHTRLYPNLSRTEAELTTPSLCSDNEVDFDGERSVEDPAPSTPPGGGEHARSRSVSISINADGGHRNLSRDPPQSNARDVIDVDMEPPAQATHHPESNMLKPRKEKERRGVDDIFGRRPPSSPLPPLSPRKPRPPARPRVRAHKLPEHGSDDDDDDPLALSYTSPPGDTSKGRTLHQDEDEHIEDRSEAPRRPPRALSVTQSNQSRQSTGTARASSRASSTSTRRARRGTLDEELSRADAFDADDDMHSGTLVGVGTRSKKQGFLAHGGAGGEPVFMGVGYVEGVEESDEEEVPLQRRGRKPKKAAASKRKGKS